MRITYYHEFPESENAANIVVAKFGIYIEEIDFYVNQFAVIRSPTGGRYISPPNWKEKDEKKWRNYAGPGDATRQEFFRKLNELVKDYEQKKKMDTRGH